MLTSKYKSYDKFAALFADQHDLYGALARAGLIPVDEVDAAEFAEVQLAVLHHDGDVPPDDGRAQVRVGVVAAEVVLADGLGKVQRLAAGMPFQ